MKALIKVSAVLAVAFGVFAAAPAFADGFKDCTKLEKASWKPASEAEAKAKECGYEVRRSKVEGSCYEVYGVKEGKLYELFYSPEDLSPEEDHRQVRRDPALAAARSSVDRRGLIRAGARGRAGHGAGVGLAAAGVSLGARLLRAARVVHAEPI